MTPPDDSSKIVIVCALKVECAAVEAGLGPDYSKRFEVIRAGMGAQSAARIGHKLAARAHPPALIVSTGFCGALIDGLKVGDTVVSPEIIDAETGRCSGSPRAAACAARIVAKLIPAPASGRTVCTRDAVCASSAKRALGLRFNACAVDMESAALAAQADLSKTSVIVYRAVSDALTDELPSEVGDFLNERGTVRIGKIAGFILKKPGNFKRLMELKRRSDRAAKSLEAAWRALRDLDWNAGA